MASILYWMAHPILKAQKIEPSTTTPCSTYKNKCTMEQGAIPLNSYREMQLMNMWTHSGARMSNGMIGVCEEWRAKESF